MNVSPQPGGSEDDRKGWKLKIQGQELRVGYWAAVGGGYFLPGSGRRFPVGLERTGLGVRLKFWKEVRLCLLLMEPVPGVTDPWRGVVWVIAPVIRRLGLGEVTGSAAGVTASGAAGPAGAAATAVD